MTADRKEDLLVALCDVLQDLVDDYERLCGDGMTADNEPFVLKRAKIVLRRAELNR